MGLRFHPVEAEGYLHVVGEGPVVLQDVADNVDEGVRLIIDLALPGALVDFSLAMLQMPIVDIFKLPDWFDARKLPRGTRIAVVLPGDPANMYKYLFFDDVSTNRGYQVRLFWESTSALRWLRKAA